MSERWFTPATARQALVTVRPAAEALCRLYRELERARPPRIRPEQPVHPAYFALVSRLHAALLEIHRRGARVQDLRGGLVGFPARRAGRRVLICWRVGDAAPAFWREPGAGLALGHPVDDDGPWDEG